MVNVVPVFLSKHDLDYIQKALEYYGLAKKEYNKNMWRIIKNIDVQMAGAKQEFWDTFYSFFIIVWASPIVFVFVVLYRHNIIVEFIDKKGRIEFKKRNRSVM